MKRLLMLTILMVFGAGLAGAVFGAEADVLLKKIDEKRSIDDMSFVLKITAYESGKVKDTNTLWGFVKISADQNKTMIYFADPSSVKGRKMLMDGNVVYYLFPKTKNPIRLSPLQVLLGETSNGDVARTGFSQDYDVDSLTEETRDGKAVLAFTLKVKESKKESSYKKVQVWVDKASLRPAYAEFYAAADKLLKKVEYRNYTLAEGKDVPQILDITDGENPAKHTTMEYLKIGRKAVADSVFRREYLETWTPEQPK